MIVLVIILFQIFLVHCQNDIDVNGRQLMSDRQVTAHPGSLKTFSGYTIFKSSGDWRRCERSAIAIMTIARDEQSWGTGNRSFVDHLTLISTFSYPLECLAVNVMMSSKPMFEKAVRNWASMQHLVSRFARVNIITHTAKEQGFDRNTRHRDDRVFQSARRRYLARLRNQLQYLTLRYEEAVLWIDADVVGIPHHLLDSMLESGKDVVVARCNEYMGAMREYDLNTWYSPKHSRHVQVSHLWPHENGTERFIPVTSVGGSFLLIKAIIIRSGITFSPFSPIGSTWESDGGDGVESEGICYSARINGYQCWGMPWKIDAVLHDDIPLLV